MRRRTRSPVFHADDIAMALLVSITSTTFSGVALMKCTLRGLYKVVRKDQAAECVKVHGRVMEYKLYEGQRHGWKNEGTIKVVLERGEVLATPSRVKEMT